MDPSKLIERWLIPFGSSTGNVINEVIKLGLYGLGLYLIFNTIRKIVSNVGQMSDPDIDPGQKKALKKNCWWVGSSVVISVAGVFGTIFFVGFLFDSFEGNLNFTGGDSGDSGDKGASGTSSSLLDFGLMELNQLTKLNLNFSIIN